MDSMLLISVWTACKILLLCVMCVLAAAGVLTQSFEAERGPTPPTACNQSVRYTPFTMVGL